MNTRFAPFDDPRAREAVAKAVDRQAINEAVYEGKAKIPESLFAENSPFHTDTPLTPHDPEGAQKLFDELADEGKPVEFTFTAFQSSQSKRVAESIQAQLDAFDNVKVEVEVLDFPAALAKSNNGEFQMTHAFSPAFIDPEMYLYQILHTGAPGNTTSFSDAQIDEALEAGRTATDPEERKAAYQKVAERMNETNPGILYITYVNGATYQPYVGGLMQYSNGSIPVDRIWTTKK